MSAALSQLHIVTVTRKVDIHVQAVSPASAIAEALWEARRREYMNTPPPWGDVPEATEMQFRGYAEAALSAPPVAAAFEAQAKLEALLAGEGDLPEGWTERWRSVYPWSDFPNGHWMGGPPSAAPRRFGLVDRQVVETDRGYVERQFVSPAVRVEEGGEGS